MLVSSAARTQVKLIVNHLLLTTAEREQGHSQGLATISDWLQKEGGLCVTAQLLRYIL